MRVLKIAIVAGEASGDMLGAKLMQAINKEALLDACHVKYIGIGGDNMQAMGLQSIANITQLAVAGFGFDVLMAIPRIYLIYRRLLHNILAFKPDIFIGIDAPGFNFIVEAKLKKIAKQIKIVHYISPTIWAWRYERIYRIKKFVDLMVCVFPQEQAMYQQENMQAVFVGHPLANSANHTHSNLNTSHASITICILVGSRVAEIKNLAPIFLATCAVIARELPQALFLLPVVNQTSKRMLEEIIVKNNIHVAHKIIVNDTKAAILASDIVLAKSGTVTLEVALAKKPLVVSYKVNKITQWIVKRKIKIPYVSQPNILLQEHLVPELLQENANPSNLAKELLALYYDKGRIDYMLKRFDDLERLVYCENGDKKAAQAILALSNPRIT